MKLVTRARCLALVLMLFISQTVLLVHAVSHTGKDSVKCVLCVCQAQQAHSLPAHNFYLTQPHGQFVKADTIRLLAPAKNQPHYYLQRAPPYIS